MIGSSLMKLSLAWIFEHIDTSFEQVDVKHLIHLLNTKVVEIEQYKECIFIPENFMYIKWTGKALSLNIDQRNDVQIGQWYLLHLKEKRWNWATMKDLGGSKEHFIPSLSAPTDHSNQNNSFQLSGQKKVDLIIEISNSALTHRADLWSHRGFAREIATLLKKKLKPIDDFLWNDIHLLRHEKTEDKCEISKFNITIKTDKCTRLSAAYIEGCSTIPSDLEIIRKLCSIDIRPRNMIVDGTNIIMADLGHPMHAFDADHLDQTITIEQGRKSICTLIDDTTIETTPADIVIINNDKPVSLAGIMGGSETSINEETHNILIEAALFCPTIIRKSSIYHGKRTDSSIRFEKGLSNQGPLIALKRYLKYFSDYYPQSIKNIPVIDIGPDQQVETIEISHKTIEQRLGIHIDKTDIISILSSLEFTVTETNNNYTIIAPYFRSSHDISIEQDIIEEIGRMYGYESITPVNPAIKTNGTINRYNRMKRAIKQLLACDKNMKELSNYAFLDTQFARTIQWSIDELLAVQLPVSDNFKYLADSLVPLILKAIIENQLHKHNARFFEIGRVWHKMDDRTIKEKEMLCFGVTHETVDFYEGKEIINHMATLYGITIDWKQLQPDTCPSWLMPYKSAALYSNDKVIGYAGMLHEKYHTILARNLPYELFCAEIDMHLFADIITDFKPFIPLPKIQPIYRSITFLLPHTVQGIEVEMCIKNIFPDFTKIHMIDFLEKNNQKAVTFEIIFYGKEQSYTKEEIDTYIKTITEQVSNNWKAPVA